jgi:hypothetical protein
MSKAAWIALLLLAVPLTARADDEHRRAHKETDFHQEGEVGVRTSTVAQTGRGLTTRRREMTGGKVRARSGTRLTPDSWATSDRTYDRAGRLKARVVRLDTTGEFDADDGMKKQRREVMRKDGTVKRETVSYAEQSRQRGMSMSKTIAWRRKDGSVRFALGVGAGFGGGLRFHMRTRFGTIGKIPAKALPRDRRASARPRR